MGLQTLLIAKSIKLREKNCLFLPGGVSNFTSFATETLSFLDYFFKKSLLKAETLFYLPFKCFALP